MRRRVTRGSHAPPAKMQLVAAINTTNVSFGRRAKRDFGWFNSFMRTKALVFLIVILVNARVSRPNSWFMPLPA